MEHIEKKPKIYSETMIKSKNQIGAEENSPTEAGLDILYTPRTDAAPIHEDVGKKILSLKLLLQKDLKAADLKWSFFVAACNTYRFDSCLRPFPPMYIKNEHKDIESLRKAIELIPPLAILLQQLNDTGVYEKYGSTIELLYWVLIRLRDPHIKSVDNMCHDFILRRVSSVMSVAEPNLIFQVASAKQSTMEEKWKTTAQGYSTFYGYHGSRLENFHSIIHYGLQQSMCKNSLFGKGIYLSSELGVSLHYSPVGYGWGASMLGSEISCIALCELINHPDVKRGDTTNEAQRLVHDSLDGRIPDKYYLVTNSELIRIRYLLVYSQEVNAIRIKNNPGLLAWFKQHKLLTFVLGYVVLLASVGLTHNKQVEKYYRLLIQKAGLE